jgi:glucose-6-phosphate dehydrogenase assembly protein OpcA
MAQPGKDGGATPAEEFSHGEAVAVVEIDKIERALAERWKEASRAQGEGTVSRAALWNLVVATRGVELGKSKALVDEIAPLLPARVLLLASEEADAALPQPDEDVHASIESNVVSRASGARVVYSEEITLRTRRGDLHFGGLVRALQVPGLPTATFWLDATMPEALLRRQLLAATDRLVVDTGRCGPARDLLAIQTCADLAAGGKPVADLGWLRLASFRLLFAGLFDAPVGGAPLRRARKVTIHHHPEAQASALLLAAWLAATLDWLLGSSPAVARPDGGLSFRLDRAARGAPSGSVEVVLEPSSGECGTSGIVALELVAEGASGGGDEVYAVRRTEQNHATLTLPIAPDRTVKLDSRRDAELCVAALGPGGRDPLFVRCLSLAARLLTSAGAS